MCVLKHGPMAFLAETVKTGDKNREVTKDTHRIASCERYRAFPERVGPQILSLESIDHFGTSDYFSGREKQVNWSGVVNFHFMQISLVMFMYL